MFSWSPPGGRGPRLVRARCDTGERMDAKLLAQWSRMAAYHGRQEEHGLRSARHREATQAPQRSGFTDPADTEIGRALARAVEDYAEECRRRARDHRRMGQLYREAIKSAWLVQG